MFNFQKDHKKLVTTAALVYVALSFLIAVMPAWQMKDIEPLPHQPELSDAALRGLHIYVRENCMACHTQQVRNISMDKVWGDRPSMPSDYFYSKQRLSVWQQSASLLGSERTGPDLTNIGQRQPGRDWHLLHFYNPRIVVAESVMPGYPWMFEEKDASAVKSTDVVVPVPAKFFGKKDKKIVAKDELLDLIAYVQTLKQTPLPGSEGIPFIESKREAQGDDAPAGSAAAGLADGKKLYMQNCAACHQANGEGLQGAFPPLKGSPVVRDKDPDFMVRIVLQGYDARPEYAQMPGFAAQLSDDEIAAIISHERASWGNNAAPVTAETVKAIREAVMNENNP